MSAEEITFDSDGCVLAGTYVQPPEPIAAALLISGSGNTDRDSDVRLPLHMMLRGQITKAVADALTDVGVATLRYDKRGVGASTGDRYRAGMSDRLADARAGLAWLADRSGGLPLLAIGHSEGTFYAAQLAADGGVAGIVLLSGPVHTGAETTKWQVQQLKDRLPAATKLILRLMRTDVVRAQRKNQDKVMASTADVMRLQGTKVNARWVRDFVRYDPAPVLARVTVPVLALTGGHDLQVPPADVAAMGELVRGPFEGHVVGDLSHMLRPDPKAIGVRGYRRATRQPVSPEVLNLITDWVSRNWGTHEPQSGRPAGANSTRAGDAR